MKSINFILKTGILSIALMAFTSGCRNSSGNTDTGAVNGEGMVTYNVSYPANGGYNDISTLPHETTFFFKGTKASFITTILNMVQIVNLLDNDNKKFTSLFLTTAGKSYAFTDLPEDVKKQESNPQFKIEPTNETKKIAGLLCQKAIVNDLTNNKKFDIYYYPKVKVYLGNCPYKDFNYLLMEYDDNKYGLSMHLQATEVNFKHIDTNMISLHGDYSWVDRDTFIKIVKGMQR
ncbi:MAG: hypothetical protein ACLQQ4_12095 [Bacteroidia bacterium]